MGYGLYIAVLGAGYYYNLTFVQLGLIDLGERFGATTPDGIQVTHDMTQEELAQLVGASRETVNKALADFAHRGWIRLESRSVTIYDAERLAKRAR